MAGENLSFTCIHSGFIKYLKSLHRSKELGYLFFAGAADQSRGVPKGNQTFNYSSDYIGSIPVAPVGMVLNISSVQLPGKAGLEVDFLMEQLFGLPNSFFFLKQFGLRGWVGGE